MSNPVAIALMENEMADIKCDQCGELVEFDPVTDEPVAHGCGQLNDEDDLLMGLNFDIRDSGDST